VSHAADHGQNEKTDARRYRESAQHRQPATVSAPRFWSSGSSQPSPGLITPSIFRLTQAAFFFAQSWSQLSVLWLVEDDRAESVKHSSLPARCVGEFSSAQAGSAIERKIKAGMKYRRRTSSLF
jgi:hypothetical protein